MRQKLVRHIITQIFKTNGVLCLVAYWLQPLNEIFTWTFFATLTLFVWSGFAWICSILDFLMND